MLFEQLERSSGAKDALQRLNEVVDALKDFGKKGAGATAEAMTKINEDLARVSKGLDDAMAIIKTNMRTIEGPELRFTEWLTPDDERIDRTFYNLIALTPAELRYGLEMPGAPKVKRGHDLADDGMIRELQLLNDQLIIADQMFSKTNPSYRNISSSPAERMKSLKLWKRYEQLVKYFSRAITTGADPGTKWVPTMQSARMIDLIQPQLKVAALFSTVDMPTKVYDLPVLGADMVAVYAPENTQIVAGDPVLNKVTLTAKKLATRNICTSEASEDSIVPMEAFVTSNSAKAIERAIEDAINNGDVAILAGGTGAQDFDCEQAQNAGYATDRRGVWNGLRYKSKISNMPAVDLATFSTANLIAIKAGMGRYGEASQGAWIVGYRALAKMLSLGEMLTLDKLGPQATVLTGQVGNYLGSPVIVSEFCRDDTGTAGLNINGTNDKGVLQYVNREAFTLGRRRDITIVRNPDIQGDSDVIQFIGTWRGVFEELFPTAAAANKTVGLGYNIA